ncbi:GNAT superfamily N-acetyltransferase [Paenibacillus phyllosphaerae]|uniref:GNAT superfamily N-acetyltransferase n=1 Tax=Paenibacillus phyllosphaerae TaxID=274593 RepID=A0A7W5B056_9BACL|nr:hypothetical protein [Paenibacillus phyllosphaerae]MBB3111993.1 GNAT superfamily N-acetyltransferase [Paenibacillus phyllosphaerae]
MQVVDLSSLISVETEEGEVQKYLSSFCCSKNEEVESFLHNRAIDAEKRDFARTSLVIDDQTDTNEIIGYFTVTVKPFHFSEDISKSTKQKLSGSKNSENFTTTLIAQLGRSDPYKGQVSGKEILELALHRCKEIKQLTGLRIVCVEYEDVQPLRDFYEENGFYFLQTNQNNNLRLSFVRLS